MKNNRDGRSAGKRAPALLCIANFPANTGYAWNYIERVYARVADHLETHGIRTLVAYPALTRSPRMLANSAALPVELEGSLNSTASVRELGRFLRSQNVRGLYLTDRPTLHPAYGVLRGFGISNIVVHDHTSGDRIRPSGVRAALKWLCARTPYLRADTVVGVSDYVVRRHLEIGRWPPRRVVRIHNAIDLPAEREESQAVSRSALGLPADRPWIVCAARCTKEKGVIHLLRAFNEVWANRSGGVRPLLVYAGEGPELTSLRTFCQTLSAKQDIHFLGYRKDIHSLLRAADLCVVPSLWQEAFGLSVAEPMAHGKPVVATRVGGIPEIIEHGVSGLLVTPGSESELSDALASLLAHPTWAQALGARAKIRIAHGFGWDAMLAKLLPVLEVGLGTSCVGEGASKALGRYGLLQRSQ